MPAFPHPHEPSERVERTAWASERLGLFWFHALFRVTSSFGQKSSILSAKRESEANASFSFSTRIFAFSYSQKKWTRFGAHLAPKDSAFAAFHFHSLTRGEWTPKNLFTTWPIIIHDQKPCSPFAHPSTKLVRNLSSLGREICFRVFWHNSRISS